MRSAFFVLVLGLAWFLIVNAVCSALAIAIAWANEAEASYHTRWSRGAVVRRFRAVVVRSVSVVRGSTWLLALRLAPAAIAALFVATVFVPSFVRLEPEGTRETLGTTVLVLVAAAAVLVVASIARGVANSLRTRRTLAAWSAGATSARLAGVSVQAYLIDSDFPVVAVAGIRRPRLFIARQVLESLTNAELAGAVAHELAHLRAADNVKRLALALSPDLLGWTRAGRSIDAAWRAAAEYSADDAAVAGDRRRAVTLASALVKVARLATHKPSFDCACAMLHDGGSIAARVERLVQPSPGQWTNHRRRAAQVAGAAIVAAAAALSAGALPAVHAVTELLVKLP